MDERASFGLWLKGRRKALRLTQEELAGRISCSGALVRKIEAEERVASQPLAELMADAFHIVPNERAAFVQFAQGRLDAITAERALWLTLHSAKSHANNLTAPPTALLGRVRELERLRELLLLDGERGRLITLTGPPGIGKTRLAVEVGAELLDYFEDGVFFVGLASIADPDLVLASIANVLSLPDKGGESLLSNLQQSISSKQMLLLLDNFEQVVDASPTVVELLGACPYLKVLVTSRESLHVHGERQFPVPPLALPAPEVARNAQALANYPAIALYAQRAQDVQPEFALNENNVQAVAAICRRLDGLPLAIELAAARVGLFSPQEMQARLDEPDAGLSMLAGGPPNLPARQRTLRAAINWSYNLLNEEEQALFARLGVFVGGFTLAAVQAVCNLGSGYRVSGVRENSSDPISHYPLPATRYPLPPQIDISEGIESLLDKSLLKREVGLDGESRFTMLETLRDYSLERLGASGSLPTLRENHVRYYLGFAAEAGAQLDGEQELLWLKRLDREYENIRAAIAWSIENEAGAATALRFASALGSYWVRHGHVSDARNFLSAALARANEVRSLEKATALSVAGRLALLQGDHPAGRSLSTQSLDLYRELGDRTGMSTVLNRLGTEYNRAGDFKQGRQALEEALAIAREIGDPKAIAEALGHLGSSIQEFGNHRDALPLFEECLALARQAQNKGLIGSVLLTLGDIARLDGDYARARSNFEESVALFEASGGKMGRAFALANLAQVILKEGDPTNAAPLLAESQALFRQMGHRRGLLLCLDGFAALYLLKGNLTRAISLLSATQAAMDRNETFLETVDRLEFEKHVAEARALEGEPMWSRAWAEGQSMTIEQAIDYALGV
jgi:predicted ATPase